MDDIVSQKIDTATSPIGRSKKGKSSLNPYTEPDIDSALKTEE